MKIKNIIKNIFKRLFHEHDFNTSIEIGFDRVPVKLLNPSDNGYSSRRFDYFPMEKGGKHFGCQILRYDDKGILLSQEIKHFKLPE